MLINAGVETIVFRGAYPDKLALELFNEAGVELIQWEPGEV